MIFDEKFVYFIADPYEAIKIGISDYVPHRFDNIQRGYAYNLRLLGVKKGGRTQEQNLHLKFKHLRLKGEWFKAEDEILDYIEKHFPLSLDYVVQRRVELNAPQGSYARRELRLIRQAKEDAKAKFLEDKAILACSLAKYERHKKNLETRIRELEHREWVVVDNTKKKVANVAVKASDEAKRITHNAQEERYAIIDDAKYRQAVIVSNAQTLASNIVYDALLQSGATLVANGCQLDIRGIINKAEQVVVEAKGKALSIVSSAQDKARNMIDDAKYREANITSMAEQQAIGR